MLLRTGNPTLREDTFRRYAHVRGAEVMSLDGTVNKTGLCLLILLAAATLAWNRLAGPLVPVMLGGLIVGTVLWLVTAFKRTALQSAAGCGLPIPSRRHLVEARRSHRQGNGGLQPESTCGALKHGEDP